MLTVPHAISDKPDKEHYRDVLAPAFANLLHESIPNSVLIMGDEKREDIDLNRERARMTHFRNKIRDELENDDILIDIHSFDEGAESRTPYDVVLLYHPDHSDLSFHKHLLDKLKENGLRTSIFWNEYGCDIINEYPNNTSVLVEINEHTENLQDIAKGISEGINSWKEEEYIMLENPMNRWQVYDSSVDPSLKHPYNQIAHQYDSSNLSMEAIDAKESTFDFINRLYEDNVITVKMDGEFNICVYNFAGSPKSDARGKKGSAPEGVKTIFANLNTLKWGFPALDEIENRIKNTKYKDGVDEVVFSGELLVHDKNGDLLRGGKARAFVGHEDDTHYYIFDIISINGTRVQGDYVSRLQLADEIIGGDGNRIHVVYWEEGGPDVAKRVWEDTIIPSGHEGLVVRSASGGSVTKVKIVHPIDLLVVGWKEGSGRIKGLMGALLLSLRDEEGIYRFNASVGTGFSDADRKWWADEMQNIETGDTKNISGDAFKLVDPTKSPIVEIECNEFHPQMYDAYEFEDGSWKYIGSRFTHIIQKPRMKRVRTDKTNNTKSLRLEQIPDYEPQSVFEINISDQELDDHNNIVQELIKNKEDLKARKKEYTKEKKEFQQMIGAKPMTYEDVGEPMSPHFVERAFVPPKKKTGGWQPWFVPEKPIEGEVKVEFPEIPEIGAKIPRVGKPSKFPPLKFKDESTPGPVPSSKKAPTGGGVSPSPPPAKKVEKIPTGEKNKKGKDIIVTYYPKPLPGVPISKLGMTCNCMEFLLNETCKHIKDSKIVKKAKSNPYTPIWAVKK